MDKEHIKTPMENNLIPTGNSWLISLKTAPAVLVLIFYSLNARHVAQCLNIDNFLISLVLVLFLPLAVLFLLLRGQIRQCSVVFNTYTMEFLTILVSFFYIFDVLRSGFEAFTQGILILIFTTSLLAL